MSPDQIIGQLLGALVGRKKKRRRSGLLGMALGGSRRGSLLTGGTLLTAAGLVWGALESMQARTVAAGPGAGPGAGGQGTPVVPPPLPGAPPLVPPPLPVVQAPAAATSAGPGPETPPPDVSALLPLIQVAIGAARADGELSDAERGIIHAHAASVGLAAAVDRALTERPALDALAAAFTDDEQRRGAYALAYAVIHGDGIVSPGERMYLTQLGRVLRLSSDDVAIIERDALAKE